MRLDRRDIISQFSLYCVTWCSTTVPIRRRNIILKHWLAWAYLRSKEYESILKGLKRLWRLQEFWSPSLHFRSSQIQNLTQCSVSPYPSLHRTSFFKMSNGKNGNVYKLHKELVREAPFKFMSLWRSWLWWYYLNGTPIKS